MSVNNRVVLLELPSLSWPASLYRPTKHFRVFVAADTRQFTSVALEQFTYSALKDGMVYFSSWGRGCERFHDNADTVIAEDQVGPRLFVGPSPSDTIMTTWHGEESLEDALDYFLLAAYPTDGFAPDSDYWIVISIDNPTWTERINRYVERSSSKP